MNVFVFGIHEVLGFEIQRILDSMGNLNFRFLVSGPRFIHIVSPFRRLVQGMKDVSLPVVEALEDEDGACTRLDMECSKACM